MPRAARSPLRIGLPDSTTALLRGTVPFEVWWESKDGTWSATWSQFQAQRRQNSVFTDVAAYNRLFTPLDGRPAIGQKVSGNYFPPLAPGAQLGRLIEPHDTDAVVVSYNLRVRQSSMPDANAVRQPWSCCAPGSRTRTISSSPARESFQGRISGLPLPSGQSDHL